MVMRPVNALGVNARGSARGDQRAGISARAPGAAGGAPRPRPGTSELGDGHFGRFHQRHHVGADLQPEVVHRAGGDDGGDDAPGRFDIDFRDDIAADDLADLALELVAHVDGLDGHGMDSCGGWKVKEEKGWKPGGSDRPAQAVRRNAGPRTVAVGGFGRGLLQHAVEDAFLEGRERCVAVRPGPRDRDALVQGDAAVLDEHHAVGQGHGLLHVVRDQQRGEAVPLPQPFDEALHLDAGERVQGAQRLVQQQQARLVDQRPGQGHTLALASGQARRPLAGTVRQAHLGEHLAATLLRARGQAQGDVVQHAPPWQQARFLEHDAGVAVQSIDGPAVDLQRSGAGALQAGDEPQQRALAAAAAADDGDELAGLDRELRLAQHVARAVALGQPARLQAQAGRGGGSGVWGGHGAVSFVHALAW